LRIAVSSLAEVGYELHLAHRLEYLRDSEYALIRDTLSAVAAPLHGLIAVRETKQTLIATNNRVLTSRRTPRG
jgi:hypothetical protein